MEGGIICICHVCIAFPHRSSMLRSVVRHSNGSKFLFSTRRARNDFFEEHAKEQHNIFEACGVFSDDEISDFVLYNVALKRYFDGHECDVEYLKL